MNLASSQSLALPYPLPGSVISIPFLLVYRHLGIVSDRWHGGKPMVISNSARRGGVYEEPWDVFAQKQSVTVENADSTLPPSRAVSRARSRIGTPYDAITWNCEHLVGHARGLRPSSPQVLATLAVAALGWMLVARQG